MFTNNEFSTADTFAYSIRTDANPLGKLANAKHFKPALSKRYVFGSVSQMESFL